MKLYDVSGEPLPTLPFLNKFTFRLQYNIVGAWTDNGTHMMKRHICVKSFDQLLGILNYYIYDTKYIVAA